MIILASASPRRQQLLSLICDEFSIEPADIDETIDKEIDFEKMPEYLALKKAKHIQKKNHYNDIVIGCDTGVFLDGVMLGKPSSASNAKEMLCRLSGRKHKVVTGCALLYKEKCISFSQATEVEFFELSDKEITDYIATSKEPRTCYVLAVRLCSDSSVVKKESHLIVYDSVAKWEGGGLQPRERQFNSDHYLHRGTVTPKPKAGV